MPFFLQPTGQTPGRILTYNTSKDMESCKIQTFGVKIIKVNIYTLLRAKMSKFGPKVDKALQQAYTYHNNGSLAACFSLPECCNAVLVYLSVLLPF